MKKVIFSLILFLSLALNVNALDKDLYDHLKENALDDGVTSSYVTGANGIDFLLPSSETNGRGIYYINSTKTSANPIVYYRGDISNNFAIYAGHCWQIVLTTDTGAVKLMYAGTPTDNKCLGVTSEMHLPKSAFGLTNETKYGGYMYYENEMYNDSLIKSVIDNWYESNMLDYNREIEDTTYCNDLTPDDSYQFAARNRLLNVGPTLACPNEYSYTVSSDIGNGRLTYPVATITADELTYLGLKLKDTTSDSFAWINSSYWAITPYSGNKNMYPNTKKAINENTFTYAAGVRPVIAVNNTAVIKRGNGERNTPYIIEVSPKYSGVKGNEYITFDSSKKLLKGETFTFNIPDRDGYALTNIVFTDLEGNVLSINYTKTGNSYSFTMPATDVIITPNFRELKEFHNLTTTNEIIDIPVQSIEEEQEAVFKVNIPHGYKVVEVSFTDGTNPLDITYDVNGEEYSFIMPNTDVVVDVTLEELPKYTVTASENIIINDSEYYATDLVSFTIKEKKGYSIDSIIVTDMEDNEIILNLNKNGNNYSFNMIDKNIKLDVKYKENLIINPLTLSDRILKDPLADSIFIIIVFFAISFEILFGIIRKTNHYN